MTQRPANVYLVVALGLFCFGFSPILVRMASSADGLTVAVWRTLFAVLFLLPFAVRKIGPEVRRFTWRERSLIAVAGILLGFHFITFIASFYYTSVASAAVLVSISPIFLAIFGYWLLKEKLTGRLILGILLGVTGAVLIGLGDAGDQTFPDATLGNSLAFLATLAVTFYLLIGRVARQGVSWLAYVFPLYVTCAITVLVFALASGAPLLVSWDIYGWCALMAIGPQIMGHGSFNYAVKYIPAAVLGLLSLSEPVISGTLAYVFWAEQPNVLAAIGMVVALAAVFLAIELPGRRKTEGLPES